MAPRHKPTVFLFDVFGTVVDWRGSVARQAAAMFGGEEQNWYGFAEAWRARYQPAMEEVRSGRRLFVKLDILHRENLDAILDDFSLSHLTGDERDEVNRFWHRLDGWPDSSAGLRVIGQHGLVCAQSNGNVRLIADMARHADLKWDAILGAEVVQAYKRLPESYTRACAIMNVAPAQAMMVAAHNDDLQSAREQGLRTAFVRRPSEHGPGQTTDLEPGDDYDFIAESLEDLGAQLGVD